MIAARSILVCLLACFVSERAFAAQPKIGPIEGLHVSHEDLPWADFGNGIFIKFPMADPYTGMYTVVLKSEGGGKVNRHRHFGSVYGITLKGAWYYKELDWLAKEGDFVLERPGSVHTLMTSPDHEENLVFFIVEGALEFLDDDDNSIVLFDWLAAANTQYEACEANGVECPDLTRPSQMELEPPEEKVKEVVVE